MKLMTFLCIVLVALCAGSIYFAFQKGILIVQLPAVFLPDEPSKATALKKTVAIYYWDQDQIKHEQATVLTGEAKAETLRAISTNWLAVCAQSCAQNKNSNVQAVLISHTGTDAYISFDHTIFGKQSSTYQKLMHVHCFLKTVADAKLGIARIHFLVHHQPLSDEHLDFSLPWPVNGFISTAV